MGAVSYSLLFPYAHLLRVRRHWTMRPMMKRTSCVIAFAYLKRASARIAVAHAAGMWPMRMAISGVATEAPAEAVARMR